VGAGFGDAPDPQDQTDTDLMHACILGSGPRLQGEE